MTLAANEVIDRSEPLPCGVGVGSAISSEFLSDWQRVPSLMSAQLIGAIDSRSEVFVAWAGGWDSLSSVCLSMVAGPNRQERRRAVRARALEVLARADRERRLEVECEAAVVPVWEDE